MSDAYELSDAEKRDLIKLINEGKSLPDKYRFILFQDKREVELVWNGKTREVSTAVLPFQTLEHIDEPRREKGEWQDQLDLYDVRGRQLKGWTNKLIWGDNKLILSSLKSGALRQQIEDAGGLKLIYIDPPFDVGADFSMDIEIGGETFHKEPNLLEQIAYRDTWGRGADSFLAMLYERFSLAHDLLHSDGSLFVHCDHRVNALIRLSLDEIFGKDHFVNEIVWRRKGGAALGEMRHLSTATDFLFWYSKGDSYQFFDLFVQAPKEYIDSQFTRSDPDGRRFMVNVMRSPSPRPNLKYDYKGYKTPPNGWAVPLETMQQLDREGRLYFPESHEKQIYKKIYLDEYQGQKANNLWTDVSTLKGSNTEILGYPTQKPEALLERVLLLASSDGDLVADFFCGSGTTAAVAEKLGRKWLMTDLGKFAIHTTRKRLIEVQRERKASDETFRAFEVLNLGRYERLVYLNVAGRLSGRKKEQALARREQEFRDLILKAYRAEPLPDAGFFHGKSGARLVVVGPINLPVGRLFVEEVITECRKRGASRVDVLAFEFEMGLFPAVLDEAKQKGIDLAPKTIPPEVFDKRAVERGQVRFHDVAYIEVTPRFDDKRPLTLAVELTDFSVFYSQGLADAITAELKEGKSDVICDAGKLVKIAKDKNGVVTREVLTKHWTDWVDYWAVDFNYENRKEIIKVPKGTGVNVVQGNLPGQEPAQRALDMPIAEFEERWTGAYIFENEWQSFRTKQNREIELISATHNYGQAGRYTIAVKVIDIFGNDTMTLIKVTVG